MYFSSIVQSLSGFIYATNPAAVHILKNLLIVWADLKAEGAFFFRAAVQRLRDWVLKDHPRWIHATGLLLQEPTVNRTRALSGLDHRVPFPCFFSALAFFGGALLRNRSASVSSNDSSSGVNVVTLPPSQNVLDVLEL